MSCRRRGRSPTRCGLVARNPRIAAQVELYAKMVIPDDDSPSSAQMMDLNMLAMLPGRERTEAEYAALFDAAGLQLRSVTHTRSPFQLLEARLGA